MIRDDQRRRFLEAISRGAPVTVAAELAELRRDVPYRLREQPTPEGREFRREWKLARRRAAELELARG